MILYVSVIKIEKVERGVNSEGGDGRYWIKWSLVMVGFLKKVICDYWEIKIGNCYGK